MPPGKCIDASPLVVKFNDKIRLFIGSHSGTFVCVDCESGRKEWELSLPGRIEATAAISNDGSIVLVGMYVFVYGTKKQFGKSFPRLSGCYDNKLYAIDSATGSITWSYHTEGIVKCTCSVASTRVIFGSYDHCLYCLELDRGALAWKTVISKGSILATPIIKDDKCIVGTLDGVLACLSCSVSLFVTQLFGFALSHRLIIHCRMALPFGSTKPTLQFLVRL